MNDESERISCLMVTRPSPHRFEFFQRSVACFQAQTYPNRDLVVVFDNGPREYVELARQHLAVLEDAVTIVQPAGPHSLGALRNISVTAAPGRVVCQWDDDDLSHPTRLSEQHRLLQEEGTVAVALQEVFHFFPRSRQLYWTNYRNALPDHCLAGTVMFRRAAGVSWPEEGPTSRKAEDSALMRQLEAAGRVVHLAGAPHLYVYVFHGGNAYEADHHHMLARSLSISRGLLERRRSTFEHLAVFDLGDEPIAVMGNNGPAFSLPL